MRLGVLVVSVLGLCGCKPTFEAKGAVTLDGVSFTPTVCHALGGATGIDLATPSGGWLTITIAPRIVDAFEEYDGDLRAEVSGPVARSLGPCGTLHLRGEGYHGGGRRAVSGKVVLHCKEAQGELSFSGCF